MSAFNLKAATRAELGEWLTAQGEPAYRADQLYRWIFAEGAEDFAAMSNLSKVFRTWLAQNAVLPKLSYRLLRDRRDATQKLIFETPDAAAFEAVLIPDKERLTLCLSTQIGCALNCAFCRTGQMGFKRDLEAWEILEQAFVARRLCGPKSISNFVFMGMGEPLLNFDNLAKAVRQLTSAEGFAVSKRRITISTAGIGGMLRRVEKELGVLLALSLNAPTQVTRQKLMPVGKKHKLAPLLQEIRGLGMSPRKRITFEYVLLDGVNDSPQEAKALIKLLAGIPCKINLLGWNRVPGMEFSPPPLARAEKFRHTLERAGFTATIRQSRGTNIGAACGQLGEEGNKKASS